MNRSEPEAPKGWPPKPKDLDAVAEAKWRETCGYLESMKVLSNVYAGALDRYARNYSLFLKAAALVKKHGIMLPGAKGGHVRNPAMTEYQKLGGELRRDEAELGLTPAAKSRLHVEKSTASAVRVRDRKAKA